MSAPDFKLSVIAAAAAILANEENTNGLHLSPTANRWLSEALVEYLRYKENPGSFSDGFHTVDELYEHRVALWITLCRVSEGSWRARLHSDGTSFEGFFILGFGKEPGVQITYHLPDRYWDQTGFAETLERGPEFDGHTPQDVLVRLGKLVW